jgi:hypothetical protein
MPSGLSRKKRRANARRKKESVNDSGGGGGGGNAKGDEKWIFVAPSPSHDPKAPIKPPPDAEWDLMADLT